MLALAEEGASEVMKYLSPREVQELSEAMSNMKAIPHNEVVRVLDVFSAVADSNSTLGLDYDEYIRSVLTKALGDDKASSLLNRILGGGGDSSGIESLKWMDSESVADLIHNEHPQTIATILVHLERDQACEVLGHFTERLRNDALLRIATLSGVQPTALRKSMPAIEVASGAQRTGLDAVYEAVAGGDIHVRFHVGTTTSRLQIGVYDVRGRLRRVLGDAPRDPGEYLLAWDRRDGSGAAMGSGIYVVSLRSPDARGTRKVVLVGH